MSSDRDLSARIFAAAVTIAVGISTAGPVGAASTRVHAAGPRSVTAAGTVNVLHSFSGAPTDGANPQGGLQYALSVVNGTLKATLFGATPNGGAHNDGIIFAQGTQTGSTFKDIFDFSGANGATPAGGLGGIIENYNFGGKFFGVSSSGGTKGLGTIYEATANGAQTVLYSFTGWGDGANPVGRLVFKHGKFYGTTSAGAKGYGTVFSYSPAAGFHTLHVFANGNDGARPLAGLALRLTIPAANAKARSAATLGRTIDPQRADESFVDRDLYGTTSIGGAGGLGSGTIFKISPLGTFTTLFTFSDSAAAPGAIPSAELATDFNGNLYGSTVNGGSGGLGEIFELTAGGTFGVIHDFEIDPNTGIAATGANPLAPLTILNNNVLYGTTSIGSLNGLGNVFSISNGAFALKYEFAGSDGASPQGNLVDGLDGNLYGTTSDGGAFGLGTIFAIGE